MGFNFREAARNLTFTHREQQTGGTKFPERHTLHVRDVDADNRALGHVDYFPPKRKGGPVHIDNLQANDVPGAGSALMEEVQRRHPDSTVKFLHERKRDQNTPSSHDRGHGDPTDWDLWHPGVQDEGVHRGFAMRLEPHHAETLNDSTKSKSEHLQALHEAIPEGKRIGMHWTTNAGLAKSFAHGGVMDPRTDIPVVLHAQAPERKDIETRPEHLFRNGVFPYDHVSKEREVPVRRGRTVEVTGISWRPDAEHPDADRNGWVHHTYGEGESKHHTARLAAFTEEDADGLGTGGSGSDMDSSTGPQEPEEVAGDETPASCSYCGSTAFTNLTDNGRVRQATCAACGGTMSAHEGAQWTPELIGDPSNHPKPDADPRSGGVGGAGAAATDPLVRDQSRIGMVYVASPEDDEAIKHLDLPLLHHDDTHEEREHKLRQHYAHLGHTFEDQENYEDGDHPLSGHHAEHGIPAFRHSTHRDVDHRVRARVAAYASEEARAAPTKRHPTFAIESEGDNPHGEGIKDHEWGIFHPKVKDIVMHRDLSDDDEGDDWDRETHVPGFSVPRGKSTPLAATISHEYGHFLHQHKIDQSDDNGYESDRKMFGDIAKHIPGTTPFEDYAGKWVKDNREHIINHVSTYAANNPKELVAELYSQYRHDPNASEAARVVGRHLSNLEERHDHGSTHAGEAGAAAARASGEGANARGAGGHHEGARTAGLASRDVTAKLTEPEMHEVLTRFGHDPRTGEQHKHREHTVTPVKHAGFKGYVEGYEGHHEQNLEDDRENFGSRHPNGGFDEDLWDNTAPPLSTHEREHYDEWGEHPDQDDYDDRHAAAYEDAKRQKDEDVKPVASHGGLYNFLSHHVTDNDFWHEHGEVKHVPLHQGVYATQTHVVDRHVNRYLKNPGDAVAHVHEFGMTPGNQEYPGTHHPLFVKHEGNYFAVEGHHRTSAALLRKEPSIEGMVYDADKHGFPHHEEDEDHYGYGEFNPEHGIHKYSAMSMGADCDFTFEEPREAHLHAIRHHDDGVCTATEVARHSEARRNPKEAAVDGPDWCTWRQAGQCTFPNDRNNTLLAIPQVRGACPWTTRYAQQICPISEPGPMALMERKGAMETHCQTPGAQFHTTISDSSVGLNVDMPKPLDLDESEAKLLESNMHNAMELVLRPYFKTSALSVPETYELAKVARQDPEFGFHVTAAWSDVRNKAKRIRAEGKVQIKAATNEGLAGVVQGDHGEYDNMITYRPGSRKIADWHCDCKWGDWAWDRIRFHGRQCSHSLALQYEAQSRGMFGKEIKLGQLSFGETQSFDELSGISDKPIEIIARTMVDADEDPADIMKVLMAYGLTHSAAHQLLLPVKESSIQVEADQEKMCQQCGHMLEEDATRCPVCGAEVKDDFPDTFHDAALHTAETEEEKKRKRHHRSNDARRHAPNFGYGVPGWIGLPLGWCPQCDGNGCGHCGGTGQVALDGNGNTADPVPDQNGDEGQMTSGGISDTSSLKTASPYYHGTTEEGLTHILPSSQHGGHVLYPGAADADHAYATTDPAEAWNYAKTKYHNTDHGVPRVYQVEPLHGDSSHVEPDPNFKDDISFRSPHGFQVTHELPMPERMRESGHWGEERPEDPWAHLGSKQEGPTVSGVALKAADTGRILMLQRSLGEDHPAAGKWEIPGGHHEPGDTTSLHAGIREFEEEVGQPFPEGGTVHHTWTSPDGVYQGHVVVIPSEKDLSMKDGRVVPNPDDPKGDGHEQAAWWEIEHARGNPVLRDEVREHTPWDEIAKAGNTEKTASAWDPLGGEDDQPGFPYAAPLHSNSKNPASTGFATSEDPKDWNFQQQVPDHLLPAGAYDSGGIYGMLHDHPEGALPSTDGADENEDKPLGWIPPGYQPPETSSSIPENDGSLSPNQYTGSVNDVVSAFQTTAGAKGIMANTPSNPGGGDMSFDYAAAARQYLAQDKGLKKSALKDFSFPEQQELINEGKREDARARNFSNLQIEGTHYEALSRALGIDDEDPEALFS